MCHFSIYLAHYDLISQPNAHIMSYFFFFALVLLIIRRAAAHAAHAQREYRPVEALASLALLPSKSPGGLAVPRTPWLLFFMGALFTVKLMCLTVRNVRASPSLFLTVRVVLYH